MQRSRFSFRTLFASLYSTMMKGTFGGTLSTTDVSDLLSRDAQRPVNRDCSAQSLRLWMGHRV
ncbi:hypothetical protein Mapa_015878 [Marchantia paleacea]|nr:hypothetical protein Mapa_015878 [Marchantia paleacea]